MSHSVGGVPDKPTQEAATVGGMIQEAQSQGITVSVLVAILGLMDGQLENLQGSLMPKIDWSLELAGGLEGFYGLFTQSTSSISSMTNPQLDQIINEFGNDVEGLPKYIAWIQSQLKTATGATKQQLESALKAAQGFQTQLNAYINQGKPPNNPLQPFWKDLVQLQKIENVMNKLKKQIDSLPVNSPQRAQLQAEYNSLKAKEQEPLLTKMQTLLPQITALAQGATTTQPAGPFCDLVTQAGQVIQLCQSLSGLWYNQAQMSLQFFRSYAQLATGWLSKIQSVIQFFSQHTQG